MARIRSALCAVLLTGCFDDEPLAAPLDARCGSESAAARAALIALGLSGEQGVFVQPLWQGGELSYLVINDRDDPVEVVVKAQAEGCERLAGPWPVEARAHQILSGSDVQGTFGRLSAWFADDVLVGVDYLGERPPREAVAPVVSNHGANGSGGDSFGQIESEFSVAPGSAFSLAVVVPPGELTLTATGLSGWGLPVLDIVDVRSVRASVSRTATGFSVFLPAPDRPGWSSAFATAEDFARVDVDVALPPGAEEASGVIFEGFFCSAFESDGSCVGGNSMSRAFALSR